MKIKSLLFIIVFFSILNQHFAQTTDLALGQWKSHLPFDRGFYVTQSTDKIYYATELAILAIDKSEFSFERMTKVEILSNVGVRIIKYNKAGDVLMVVYNNGGIDLINDEGNLTVFSIEDSDIIIGEKIVHDIFMANDSTAYLAANYGISEFNVQNGKSPTTIKTPIPILSISVFDNYIYAGTEEGVYRIPENNNGLEDFNNWEFLDESFGFPADYFTETMAVYSEKLFLEVNDSLYSFDGQTANFTHFIDNQKLNFISAEGQRLLAGFEHNSSVLGSSLFIMKADESFDYSPNGCLRRPQYAIEDESGDIWIANNWPKFFQLLNEGGSCNEFEVSSPPSKRISEIAVGENQIWIASGGIEPESFVGLGNNDGFFSLIDNQWSVYNRFQEPFLSFNGFWSDFYTVKIHPENGKIYTGSFNSGLAEYDNGTISLYDDENSSLQEGVGTGGNVRVTGLAFDEENNLWISNHLAPEPLSVLTNEGEWISLKPPTGGETLMDIAIDAFGYKWIKLSDKFLGILVFDEGDINDPSDDRAKVLTTSNSNLPSNEVRSLETDLDGNVWVGTKIGPIVFECSVLDSDCQGSLRIVEQDNFGAFLLENEDIMSIAVDGANRKWFGTTNGIFVQSSSGEDQIARFTAENSPLFDNVIQDIAIDGITGEVYIGTQQGLQIYRGNATVGGNIHNNVTVFPNPVRPEYTGSISIKGLTKDANVKITDINGQLVFETTAFGGQAIWDGHDYSGRKANSGVYLVFSTSDDTINPNTAIGKILLIR